MNLVPIPFDAIDGTEIFWLPFIQSIARRSRCHTEQLVGMVRSGEVHLFLAWNTETRTALALAGSRFVLRGDGVVGELIWMTGKGRHDWQHLLAEIETYHRDHLGCVGFKALARPGWAPLLKARGYRLTHVQYEKDF